jgi:hypothetical protein
MRKLLFVLAALISVSQAQTIQYIGAPTTTVISKGNFRSDSLFYLPKRSKLPTDSGAVRYQISDSSVYYWTGSNWRRLGVHIDTASMLNPYLRGSGTANYLPIFDATRSVINSKVYQSGTNLLFNTTTASFTSTGISTIEANNTSASVFALKVLDTTRSYIASNSSNTMDINNLREGDIRFYTSATLRGRFQTDGTFRLNSLTGTGTRSVVADANGVLSASSTPTDLIDTTYISTRAWRQKGDDSLGAIIATKGSGTVTSVAALTLGTTGTDLSSTVANSTTTPVITLNVPNASSTNRGVITTGTQTISGVKTFTDNLLVGTPTASGSGGLSIAVGNTVGGAVVAKDTDGATAEMQAFAGLTYFYATTNHPLLIGTNNTERIRVLAGGDVGIGTSTPARKLDISGTLRSTQGASFATSSGDVSIGTTTSGNLGIGTSSPLVKLDIRTTDTVKLYMISTNASNLENSIQSYYGNGAAFGSLKLVGLDLRFNTGASGTETMRLTSGNELLLNTTTDAGDYKLQVSGNAYVTGTTVLAATSGNVAIGKTTAQTNAKLDVDGNLFLKDTARIKFRNSQSGLGSYTLGYIESDPRYPIRMALDADAVRPRYFEVGHYTSNDIANTWNGQILMNAYNGSMSLGSGAAPVASAQLDVTSTTRGFLPPRMTTTQRDAISSPAAGLVIYNTTTSKLQVYTTAWTDLH